MIVKLVLKEYIPLLSKGVRSVTLDLPGIINILLGKNGHGKSAILNELNELPPENGNYKKDGYKLVESVHNGKRYLLESWTGTKSRHSFKLFEKGSYIELNEGQTGAVQKELAKQHFGLTPNVFRVLSSIRENDRFSALSPQQRKDFFMDVYPNDTRFALKVYNDIKSEFMDTTGAIKNLTRRLTEETHRASLIAEKSPEEIQDEIKQLDKRIGETLYLQGQVGDAKGVSDELRTTLSTFKQKVDTLVTQGITTGLCSREELSRNLESLEDSLRYHEAHQKMYQERINEIATAMSGISVDDSDPKKFEAQLGGLSEKLRYVQEQILGSAQLVKQHSFFVENKEGLMGLVEVIDRLIQLITAVPLASSKEITQEGYRKTESDLEELRVKGRYLSEELGNLEHQLKHYENSDEIECPDCKSKFKPGFEKGSLERMQARKISMTKEIEIARNEYRRAQAILENDREWDIGMIQLKRFIHQTPNPELLDKLIKEYEVGYVSSDILTNTLATFVSLFNLNKEKKALKEESDILQTRINVLKRNNMEETLKQYALFEGRLEEVNRSIKRCRKYIVEHMKRKEAYDSYEMALSGLEQDKERLLQLLVDEGRFELKLKLNDLVSETIPQKDRLTGLLIRRESMQSVISSIETNLTELQERRELLKVVMDGLCPKKGFIGKLMLDFITTVCGNMNSVIREVWSTPLYVMPCVNSKGELDYNFPVVNGESGSTNKEISYCSGGEKEIINFAFRLTMMKYHKHDFPLFLDEVGVAMDEYHRKRFFDYVKRLSLSGEITQMFMVSHYLSQYGLMDKANLIALNTEGLTVPSNLNAHTVIE